MILWSGVNESLMKRKPLLYSSLLWVQMTLAGCGSHEEVCVPMSVWWWWKVARRAAVCVCAAASQEVRASVVATTFSALPMPSHLSLVAEVQENHCRNNKTKMLDKIKSLSTKVKNQHEECQCLRREREKKDILKYTFIQSLCKIKQQNWSTLPSTLALLPPLNSPSHQVLTFRMGHRHDDSGLACCHLSSGQNPVYYAIGFIWLPGAKICLEECTESYSHPLSVFHTLTIINFSTRPTCSEPLVPRGPLRPQTMV